MDIDDEVSPLGSPLNMRLAKNTNLIEMDKNWPPDKCCKVCGDRAVGYNFGIISCESCKAFFRRNASREADISCPFSNKCEINKVSRKFCQSCRLQKCLNAGMRKEWLMGEKPFRIQRHFATHNQKLRRTFDRSSTPTLEEIKKFTVPNSDQVYLPKEMFEKLIQKVEHAKNPESNAPKQCICHCQCGYYPSDAQLIAKDLPNALPEPNVAPSNSTIIGTLSQPRPHPFYADFVNMSSPTNANAMPNASNNQVKLSLAHNFPPTPYSTWYTNSPIQETNSLQDYFTGITQSCGVSTGSVLRRYDALNSLAGTIGSECFATHSSRHIPPESGMSTTIPSALISEDKTLMQELIVANEILKEPMDVTMFNEGELSFIDVVKISDMAMRRIINMAKKLNMFLEQDKKDQIAILKGSLSELLILRGVMVFDPSLDSWRHSVYHGTKEIPLTFDILKKTPEQKHYAEHKKFLMSFDERWRRNENVMLILNAITLFCPDRTNIINVSKVKACQLRYYDLLKRYLNTQCPESESRQAYDSLLRKLVDLHELNQSLLRIYSYVNPSDLDPLLKELFFDIIPAST